MPMAMAIEVKPKSEIRFGWGLMYDYYGQMLHGLDRYNVMIGLKLPDFRIDEVDVPQKLDPDYCDRFPAGPKRILKKVCNNVWPSYMQTMEKLKTYRNQIDNILEKELPAILPGFKSSDLAENRNQMQGPKWRWVH